MHTGFLLKYPEPPFKSPWRMEFERRSAEDRAKPRRVLAPQVKPQRVRKPKPRKMRTLCSCGAVMLRKEALYCYECESLPKKAGLGKKCSVCETPLNRNNSSGLCKTHGDHVYRKLREIQKFGPRPVCTFEAGGMKCVQQLYRDNTTHLCMFHNGRELPSEYRGRQPKMVAK
jgi:hypothetical protein